MTSYDNGNVYDFKEQNELGKVGEAIVFKHLRNKTTTVGVIDISLEKRFQALGIDWLWIYENASTGILHTTFFDVKTDYYSHRNDKLFIEISSSVGTGADKKFVDKGILSTKAEYFLYLDPVLGRLFHIPIYSIREWYKTKWLAKKHSTVTDIRWYETEGIAMHIDELKEIIPFMEIEIGLETVEYKPKNSWGI